MRLDRYDQGGYAGGGITENGGNISGPLVLAGNPSQTLEAVPKQYVDAYFNSLNASNLTAGTLAAARLPNFTGDLQSVAGTSQLTLTNSGVTPGEYGKVTVNAKGIVTSGGDISDTDIPFGLGWDKINPVTLPSTLAGYGITNAVNVSGGTLTGFLSVTNQPTLGTHVATKQYVDALVNSGGIAVGDILRKPYSTTPAGFLKCNGGEVSKTTYSELYAIIGDKYNHNLQPGSGKPWEQQFFTNNSQIGLIDNWSSYASFPVSITNGATFITKNRIYYIGGQSQIGIRLNVFTAPINADGTIGAWTETGAFPIAIHNHDAIIIKNKVYVTGGYGPSGRLNTIYMASINADGTLGAWLNSGITLPVAVDSHKTIITTNKLYLITGIGAAGYKYFTTINSDGTLNANWTAFSDSSLAMAQAGVFIIKNKIYIISNGANGNQLHCADIDSTGIIGLFSKISNFVNISVILNHPAIVTTKNRVYMFSGSAGGGGGSNISLYADVNLDGTLGTWMTGTPLSSSISQTKVVTTASRIYLLTGYNGMFLSDILSANFSGIGNDYSPYYDGTIIPTDSANFRLPDLSSDEPFGSYSYIKY